MKRSMAVALTLTLALTGVTAAAAQKPARAKAQQAAATVLPPDQDPFYVPPAGYESRPNGAVLRARSITAIYLVVPVPVKAYQVLYKSLDGHDQPVAEAATILVPETPWTGNGTRPLVSYQLAEDSLATRCEPSYTLRVGFGAPTPASTYEVAVSLPALARGYAIVYADYEGPHSQFIAGAQTAHGVLDGIRAAERYAPDGLGPDTQVGLEGYSGGGFATTWASEQQPSYAPELRVVGAAAGGIPADLKDVFAYNDGNIGAGLLILGIIGLTRAYPEAGVASILNDKGKALFAADNDNCTLDTALFHPFDHIANYTTVKDVIGSPQAAFLFKAADAGQGVPGSPVYNYQAVNDELVPVPQVDRLVQKYCAEGVTVQKVRIPFAEHIAGEIEGSTPALQFLTDRFDGKPPTSNC